MPEWITSWLDPLSPWQQVLIFCAFFVAIAWLGLLLVHPILRRHLHGDAPSNEVIIFTAANYGLFYAVLLGLLTIATFDSTKALVDTIGRETNSLSTLYRTADGYPEPLRSQLKSELRDYTRYVIDKDWRAHRRGLVLTGGEHRLEVIRATVFSYEPTSKTQELLHTEMLHYLDAMMASRQDRLIAVTAAIPGVLWYIVFIGALITIAFVWMMHIKFESQIVLGGITALFLGIMIFLIYAMDNPLRGAVSVSPEAFDSVYDLVMKWDN
jgi:Protein of unknown function (DUF4239)